MKKLIIIAALGAATLAGLTGCAPKNSALSGAFGLPLRAPSDFSSKDVAFCWAYGCRTGIPPYAVERNAAGKPEIVRKPKITYGTGKKDAATGDWLYPFEATAYAPADLYADDGWVTNREGEEEHFTGTLRVHALGVKGWFRNGYRVENLRADHALGISKEWLDQRREERAKAQAARQAAPVPAPVPAPAQVAPAPVPVPAPASAPAASPAVAAPTNQQVPQAAATPVATPKPAISAALREATDKVVYKGAKFHASLVTSPYETLEYVAIIDSKDGDKVTLSLTREDNPALTAKFSGKVVYDGDKASVRLREVSATPKIYHNTPLDGKVRLDVNADGLSGTIDDFCAFTLERDSASSASANETKAADSVPALRAASAKVVFKGAKFTGIVVSESGRNSLPVDAVITELRDTAVALQLIRKDNANAVATYRGNLVIETNPNSATLQLREADKTPDFWGNWYVEAPMTLTVDGTGLRGTVMSMPGNHKIQLDPSSTP